MISSEHLGSIAGAPVMGPDDDRIGTVGQIFADPTSGAPTWVTVHTGLFGRHESFVPLESASWDREILHIPYDKDRVKGAPRIDTEGSLEPELEAELSRYYGLGAVEQAAASAPPEPQDAGTGTNDTGTEPEDASPEERLDPQRKGRHRA